ncbi:hypothetical protein [Agrobacterium tumefaciens]|uniref:hypothetical protein n=1 Tax=Agrobacterium tumefaciens TaxID=358 RepID=UPI00157353E9|nr:hypothetical protein [Agrobacterium tumefaciens]
MPKAYPREQIAIELSELRHVRSRIADLQEIGWSLMSQSKASDTPVSDDLVKDLKTAIGLIDRMDKVATARMEALYKMPTPKTNDNGKVEAA